jgi:hypothetical protein
MEKVDTAPGREKLENETKLKRALSCCLIHTGYTLFLYCEKQMGFSAWEPCRTMLERPVFWTAQGSCSSTFGRSAVTFPAESAIRDFLLLDWKPMSVGEWGCLDHPQLFWFFFFVYARQSISITLGWNVVFLRILLMPTSSWNNCAIRRSRREMYPSRYNNRHTCFG